MPAFTSIAPTALMLIGDDARAQSSYAHGVRLAGGLEQAQALMGLPHETQDADRAAQKTVLDPEQIRAVLQARRDLGAERHRSTRAGSGAAPCGAGKKPSAWRSAGPRAADGADNSRLLYWKR